MRSFAYTAWPSRAVFGSGTAAQAELKGWRPMAATAAYEATFAMTVPPPVIAANRALLAALVPGGPLPAGTKPLACRRPAYVTLTYHSGDSCLRAHTIGSIRPELVLDLTPDPDCERQARFDVALREV